MSLTWVTLCKYPGQHRRKSGENCRETKQSPLLIYSKCSKWKLMVSILILENATREEQFHLYFGKLSFPWVRLLIFHPWKAEVCMGPWSWVVGTKASRIILEDVASDCCHFPFGGVLTCSMFPPSFLPLFSPLSSLPPSEESPQTVRDQAGAYASPAQGSWLLAGGLEGGEGIMGSFCIMHTLDSFLRSSMNNGSLSAYFKG